MDKIEYGLFKRAYFGRRFHPSIRLPLGPWLAGPRSAASEIQSLSHESLRNGRFKTPSFGTRCDRLVVQPPFGPWLEIPCSAGLGKVW
jgi:hypothetical protein